MTEQPESTEQSSSPIPEYTAPLTRVFRVTYVDRNVKDETFHSHYYQVEGGVLIFMDEALVDDKRVLYHRHVVAAGQWRRLSEIGAAATSERAH